MLLCSQNFMLLRLFNDLSDFNISLTLTSFIILEENCNISNSISKNFICLQREIQFKFIFGFSFFFGAILFSYVFL